MNEKEEFRFENRLNKENIKFRTLNPVWDNEIEDTLNVFEMITEMNKLHDNNCQLKRDDAQLIVLANKIAHENKKLKQDLKDCKKLAGKRLNKIRNHRAVIEDLGGSIRAYKGQISQLNEKIEKIQEAMEDTGALTKRQLKEILND